MKYRKIIYVLIAVICTACGGGTFNPERPHTPPVETDPKQDEALKDATIRAEWPGSTLRYNDGGVIFGRTTSGTVYAVDISTGHRIDVDPKDGSVVVDNVRLSTYDFKIAQKQDGVIWYTASISGTDAGSVIFVTKY